MLQILSGTVAAADLLPAGSVYSLPSNSTIEVSIPGGFPVSSNTISCDGLLMESHVFLASYAFARTQLRRRPRGW